MPGMRTPCRVVMDSPRDGVWNMAVDEALLQSAAARNEPTLRCYRWSEPTLSLGYFQSYADRQSHAESRQAAIVRRSSGGGAIVHDDELTYSLSIPPNSPWASDTQQLYDAVHSALVEVLAAHGIVATLRPAPPPLPRGEEPFLCFQRAAAGDVLVQGVKIAGSAQRRTQTGVLQHGSLLLGQSAQAPQLPGLVELAGSRLAPPLLAQQWTAAMFERLHWQDAAAAAGLLPEETSAAAEISQARYGNPQWTRRR